MISPYIVKFDVETDTVWQPLPSAIVDGEKDVILPAIAGTKSIFASASKEPSVKRLVYTSSFTSIYDSAKQLDPTWTYTAEQWNPITYDEAKASNHMDAYRGAKKFSEQWAWEYMKDTKPHFDLVTLVPPIVYGPLVHDVTKIAKLNSSSQWIWTVVSGRDYSSLQAPF